MLEEEEMVTGLGLGEVGVEAAESVIERGAGQETEALTGAGLDESAEDELIEKRGPAVTVVADELVQALHVDVGCGSGECSPSIAHQRVDLLEVAELFPGQGGHIANEHRSLGEATGDRHRVGGRLELTVRVVDEQRIEIGGGDLDPAWGSGFGEWKPGERVIG
jgi:hypothetical protein